MLVALCCLGDLAVQRGQLRAAAGMYQQAIALVGARPIWEALGGRDWAGRSGARAE